MARRKRRASRHQRGLETVPEKLLVKIIEARLAGRRARQDPEPLSLWPGPGEFFQQISRKSLEKEAELLAETIVKPPPVGTSGRFLRMPTREAKELREQWLEKWPEAANFFSGVPKKENFHKGSHGIIVCIGEKCQVCKESKPASRDVLAYLDYAGLETRALLFGRNEGIGRRLMLKKRA